LARSCTAFFIALALNTDFIGLQAQDLNLVTAVLVMLGAGAADGQAQAETAVQGEPDMLKAQELKITFNPGTPIENRALRGLDLEIPTGQFVTVIGSNGAGKSTFLNAMSGDLLVDKRQHRDRRR
jgi:ABC-type transport system involved in cytochrome bd biosynthesis fused ATPase/permease subunit